MNLNYKEIPFILSVGTFQNPVPRGLTQLAEILNYAYRIFDHPLFQEGVRTESFDPFRDAMDNPELYKSFNRTVIERTIYQANYFSKIKINDAFLTVAGRGIELAVSDLRDYWEALNKILARSEEERRQDAVHIRHFMLVAAGVFTAHLKFFLATTQEISTQVIRDHIAEQVKKHESYEAKYQFLIKWRGDLLKQEEQFSAASYTAILKLIDIELEVVEKLYNFRPAGNELNMLVTNFFKDQEARISNDKLLAFLKNEQYELFQESLKDLVINLFSYHDITVNEPEKVYHSFLLGLFNAFSGIYELKSNKEAGLGRFDLLLIPQNISERGVIFEVKRSLTDNLTTMKKQTLEALEQIRSNQYKTDLQARGVIKWVSIAAVFYGKKLEMDFELSENSI